MSISVLGCDDNGIFLDLLDDMFIFMFFVLGGSFGSWVGVIGGVVVFGAYGIDYIFGLYLVNEGDI